MRKITVLITGGGAPGIAGTIYALRSNEDRREVRIVTVDAREDVVGKYISEKFYKIPKADDEKFLQALLEVAIQEGVDVILPQVTRELNKLAENKKVFEEKGIRVVVMEKEVLEILNNKFLLMKEYSALGYNQGKFRLINSKKELREFALEVGYPHNPFVVKLPVSNGMRGLRIITEEVLTVDRFINEKPSGERATLKEIEKLYDEASLQLVAMEYFPGPEYTIDVYRSPLTGKVVVIPRKREVIRTGITFEGVLKENKELIEKSLRLSERVNATFCFGFQFKQRSDGEFGLLESNPRVQGTMIMSVLGGANMIYWAVKEALGEEVDIDTVRVKWGLRFKRYWGGIAVVDDEVVKLEL